MAVNRKPVRGWLVLFGGEPVRLDLSERVARRYARWLNASPTPAVVVPVFCVADLSPRRCRPKQGRAASH